MGQLTAESTVIIVGAGQAGAETAAELRKLGFAGRIVMLGQEPQPPYKRPPLSKAYLAGGMQEEALYVLSASQLARLDVSFRGNARVLRIDRGGKCVHLEDGTTQAYDRLVLATGGRARGLSVPGADAPNVLGLRTIEDVNRIRQHCQPGRRLTIVGGGFIGLEVAAMAVKLGLQVTLLEGLPRVLSRVTVPQVSAFFERVHREAGVDLRTAVQLAGFEGAPVTAVLLADGSRIQTDLVVVGIGLLPNTELAQAAGLTVDNGIVVDEYARTADADILAAGDCTLHPSAFLGGRVRLESVQNAMEQGRAAARTLMGRDEPYRTVPWFWSDQYDLKLQMVGTSQAYEQCVLRGDPATQRSFALFYLRQGRLMGADMVNRAPDFGLARKWVAEGACPDPLQLADETVPLKSLTPPPAV